MEKLPINLDRVSSGSEKNYPLELILILYFSSNPIVEVSFIFGQTFVSLK